MMTHDIAIGDRFRRQDVPRKLYRVSAITEPTHHPPHVILVDARHPCDRLTISLIVLADERYWHQAS